MMTVCFFVNPRHFFAEGLDSLMTRKDFPFEYPNKAGLSEDLNHLGSIKHPGIVGSFDGPAKGYAKLIELTKELKPTVILICYGQNESYAGTQGVKAFAAQYEKLLKDLAPTKA